MDEILNEFPARHRGRPSIYPWDEWLDGRVHRVRQGTQEEKDRGDAGFVPDPASFRALVHRTATARGLKAQTKIQGNTVVFYAK